VFGLLCGLHFLALKGRIFSFREDLPRLVSFVPCLFEAQIWVFAKREQLLLTHPAVREAPQLGAVWIDQHEQAIKIGLFVWPFFGLERPDLGIA
jgi:hypothetical protein